MALGLTALLVASSAHAAPAWLAPTDLSSPDVDSSRPQVALDAAADAVAVWTANGVVQASFRRAGSAGWQAPVDLTPAGQSGPRSRVQVAFAPGGDAVAVWSGAGNPSSGLWASVRPAATGSWQPPVLVGAADKGVANARVVLDAQGNAIAMWDSFTGPSFYSGTVFYDGTDHVVKAAVRSAATGAWAAPTDLSAPDRFDNTPDLAVDPRGNVYAVWEHYIEGAGRHLQARIRTAATGAWESAVDLVAPGGVVFDPQVAVDGAGNATAVWSGSGGIKGSTRPAATGTWQPPLDVSVPGEVTGAPDLALDGAGNATAAWTRVQNGRTIRAATRRAAAGTWAAPVDVAPPSSEADVPRLAVDAGGDAIAVWRGQSGNDHVTRAAVRSGPDGTWQQATDLGGPINSEVGVASDPSGNAFAVWWRLGDENSVIRAAAHDGAAPILRRLSVPRSAAAGQRLQFSVSPLDALSALGTIRWTFGDGDTALGASAAHTYREAGRYRVLLTVADVLGNARTRSLSVPIRPASPTARPPEYVTGDDTGAADLTPGDDLPEGDVTDDPPATAGPPDARLAPRIRAARLARKHFRFGLSQPADVTITVNRIMPGLRRAKRCVAPTDQLRRHHARRCRRATTLGTLTHAGRPRGANSIAFNRRVAARRLAPGRYIATLRARNTAGRSKRAIVRFRIR